ncbi:MAG: efflux RND transporter periplasmic adaptor subunit [Sandaracinaceae bacterium]
MSESRWSWARRAGALTAVVGGLVWWASAGAQSSRPLTESTRGAASVVVATVHRSVGRTAHRAHAVVEARQRARLSFTEGGRLSTREAHVGDRVEPGQVLARLEAGGQVNAVRAAGAQTRELNAARAQLARDRDRMRRLSAEGVRTQAQLEAVESGFERIEAQQAAARAQLRESRRRRTEAVLRAPFAGVVTDVLVEPGELIAPGQPVLRIVAPESGLELHLAVPNDVAEGLAVGDEVPLFAVGTVADDPLLARPFLGRITAVAHNAAASTRLHPVRVDVSPSSDLAAGAGVEARLTIQGPARLTVPLAAVMNPSGQRAFVWKAVDGQAVRAWVRLGSLEGSAVEIREGLSPGDEVIVEGQTRLLEGDALRVGSDS